MKYLKLKLLFLFLTSATLVSCFPSSSNNPKKAYKYWLGVEPPNELKLINGQYYQSPHFTLEYEVFLEMNVTKEWWNGFVRNNALIIDDTSYEFITEIPKWFKINSNYTKYLRKNDFSRSAYFINLSNGKCFVYETVGM